MAKRDLYKVRFPKQWLALTQLDVKILSALTLIFCMSAFAQNADSYNYSTTWRIVYFQDSNQFVNQRPDNEYNPSQGFIFIYEILNKYVPQMQPFHQGDFSAELQSLGIWTQLYLVNDVAYQTLFIGDHSLSDGKAWVMMNDDDYAALSQLLLARKNKTGDAFDGDKDSALKNLLWKGYEGQHLEDFNTHFHITTNNATTDAHKTEASPVTHSSLGAPSEIDKPADHNPISTGQSRQAIHQTSLIADSAMQENHGNHLQGTPVETITNEPVVEHKFWLGVLSVVLAFFAVLIAKRKH